MRNCQRYYLIIIGFFVQAEEKDESLWDFIEQWHISKRAESDTSCWRQIVDTASKFLSPAMTRVRT